MIVSIVWLLVIYFCNINVDDGKLLVKVYIPFALLETVIFFILLPKVADLIDRWREKND